MHTVWLYAGVLGYLLGSVPFGYLLGRLRGVDVRRHGSGATGATNVARTLGLGPALLTVALDALKGFLAAYLGLRLGGEWGYAAAGLGAVLGHSWPVWLGFRGGKSVATGAGVLLVLHPAAVGVAVLVAAAFIVPTRYVSLGSIAGTVALASWIAATAPLPHKLTAALAGAIVLWRHRGNVQRLLAGTERRFGERAA